jgi:predicted metal-dependent phosphoesterase TrpH
MIDLHSHSTHSDGSLTPALLVDYAVTQGLDALALTDHDVISGNAEAQSRAQERGILFIPGVELEINNERGEFHLLGLNLCTNCGPLEARLQLVRKNRSNRNVRIIEKMNRAGVNVTSEDIDTLAAGEIVSRLHIAQYLVNQGHASSIKDAFARFLEKGKPFFEQKEALDLSEAISLIREAGGKTVIAHPFSLSFLWEDLKAFLLECREEGLDGIEAYHSDYPLEDCRKLEIFGNTRGFIITAGSDFHGTNMPERKLGYSSGGLGIENRFLSWMDGAQY